MARTSCKGWWRRRLPTALLPTVLLVVFLALVITIVSALALTLFVYGWPPSIPPDTATTDSGKFLESVRIGLTVAAGVGGAVALTVAYRKQDLLERSETGYHDRYAAAAAQLGHAEATARLAGVYALTNLADQWDMQRQQCVDVLCANLRLPWGPIPDIDHPLATKTVVRAASRRRGAETVTYAYPDQLGEAEVRKTILRIIAKHLQPNATSTWSDLTLDFRGATLPDCDFSGAEISTQAWFQGTTFAGEAHFCSTRFRDGAMFTGAIFDREVRFDSAHFIKGVSFKDANFRKGASFKSSIFGDDFDDNLADGRNSSSFSEAKFGGDACFSGATFVGYHSFVNTTFRGMAQFEATTHGSCDFQGTCFHKYASFYSAEFKGQAGFDDANFSEDAMFNRALFSACASFKRARFTENALFENAAFNESTKFGGSRFGLFCNFDDAKFLRAASFFKVKFAETTWFNGVEFRAVPTFSETNFPTAPGFVDAKFLMGTPLELRSYIRD